jgi:hypothetical protein
VPGSRAAYKGRVEPSIHRDRSALVDDAIARRAADRIVAFFESTFRKSKAGSCLRARNLAQEPDVTVERAKGKRPPRRTK